MSESVRDLFCLIDEIDSADWLIRDTEIEVGDRTVCLARDPQGNAAILIPVESQPARLLFQSRGVAGRIGPLSDGGQLLDWLMVSCSVSYLEQTFFLLCDDVLAEVTGVTETGDNLVSGVLAVVERWRALMEKINSPLMGSEAYIGLLAELHAMEALVPGHGPDQVLKAWAGPDRSRIDFRFSDLGIEVKATTGRDRFRVTIHGLLQLDDSEVGDLRLYAEQLEQVPSGGDSLPAVVQRLIRAGVSEHQLRLALGRAGYYPIDEDAYRQMRFKVLDRRGVRVGPSTPRIVASSFKEKTHAEVVSSVSYVLDLTSITVENGRLEPATDVFVEGIA